MSTGIAERSASIVAVLGPTNTGKTHRAIERMLEHESGMIGLPLRLLAREVYDRVAKRVGEALVALVTGEEKCVPPRPCYWVCTVEAMPTTRIVDFVAIDEIQLAAHHQRGHVFTDRLLHCRGERETWFMGSDSMEPVIRELVPTAEVRRHPRLSTLRGLGSMGLSALPPRSALVAFSAPRVYEIAERVRHRRGGAAVVLGALSPRTRNAQVSLYQSGEVQFMVATDAIGMGLNMDIDTVAFAAIDKFDGRHPRPLDAAELAQIAGRAGRHLNDGSFATLAPVPPLHDRVRHAIETHHFAPVRRLVWRNSDLDTTSIESLVASLRATPRKPSLRLIESAEDFTSLLQLSSRPSVRSRVRSSEHVHLLWDVCQVPDYRQLMPEVHAALLEEIFLGLMASGHIESDWMDRRVSRLDDLQGDLDTLTTRVAFIRTWTYVANHGSWVKDAGHWQLRTREIEDRLSDAIHDRLMQRFVVGGRTARRVQPRPQVKNSRPVSQDDYPGWNTPFRVLAGRRLPSAPSSAEKVAPTDWLVRVAEATDESFRVDEDAKLWHCGDRIGRLTRGVDILRPQVTLTIDPHPGPDLAALVVRRLVSWIRDRVKGLLQSLQQPQAQPLSRAGRGLVYQLEQGLGTASVAAARDQMRLLTPRDVNLLQRMDVRLARRVIFVRHLLAQHQQVCRIALCRAFYPKTIPTPPVGSSAFRAREGNEMFFMSMGYVLLGNWALRADLVDRIDSLLVHLSQKGRFVPPKWLVDWIGDTEMVDILSVFGCQLSEPGRYEVMPLRSASRSQIDKQRPCGPAD